LNSRGGSFIGIRTLEGEVSPKGFTLQKYHVQLYIYIYIYIYITSQDIQWIPIRYPPVITIKKNNPKKKDALCMNMKPKFEALSLELKV
jgi:hypothetical protein